MHARGLVIVALLTLIAAAFVLAQGAGYRPGNAISVTPTVPVTCNIGETAIVTTTVMNQPMGTYFCTQPNVWQRMNYAILKNFTNLQNNVFSDLLTITIPNVGASSLIQVDLVGALGAGGAMGEFESTTGRTVYITVTRVANVNSDTTLTVISNAADAHVAGGAGITLGTQMSATAGGPTDIQTLTLQGRVVRGGGTSNNHSISIRALILKQFVQGVAIS